MDTKKLRSFRLVLKECHYRDIVVEAPDLDTALDRAEASWVHGERSPMEGGYATVLDEEGEVLREITFW